MVDELVFPSEKIPDSDIVFMRAHQMFFAGTVLNPGVFRAHRGSMSVNWAKYASAEETKQQAKKNPDQNAVLSLVVGGIRLIDSLDVKHAPEATNRAHSEVSLPADNEELTEVRVLLNRLAVVVIPLSQSPPT